MILLFLLFLVDFFFSIFAIPFWLILFSPLWLYKRCVTIVAKIFAPDLIPLEVADSYMSWDILRPKNGRHVYSIGVTVRVNGILSLERVQKVIIAKILEKKTGNLNSYHRLFEYFVSFGGYAFRKREENFDINCHIREIKVQKEVLDTFRTMWIEAPYSQKMSPWEILVIPDEEAGETYILFKNHHAIGDGYSQLKILNFIIDQSLPSPPREPEDSIWVKLRQLLAVTRVSSQYALEVMRSVGSLPWKKDCIDGDIFFSSSALYVSDLKQIMRKTGASYATITLTLFGGFITRILDQSGEQWKKKKATYVGLSLPRPNHPISGMWNHWTSGGIRVPLGPMTSLERLRQIEEDYNKFLSRELDKMMYRYLMPPGSLIPIRFGEVGYEFFRKISELRTIFTSVMSFTEQSFDIDGHPIISITPTNGNLGTTPVLIGIGFCYKDYLLCTFNASQEVAKNQETLDRFVHYFEEELEKFVTEVS